MADDLELLALAAVTQLQPPVIATPVTTTSAGTMTSGTTEIMDSVLGVYQCSLIAGRRYIALMNGLTGGGSVAGDVYQVKIRNSGSSSTPTTSSALIAISQWVATAAGGAGEEFIQLGQSFIAPATGINTFAMFAVRAAGTGVFTPLSTAGVGRELYVMYLGAV